jgi:hypothetical protein
MRALAAALLVTTLIAGPGAGLARADGVFSGRVALTGFLYTESDGVDPAMAPEKKLATTNLMAYGELRLTMNALRMAAGKIDFRFDMRARVTGDFDFERKFNMDESMTGVPLGVSSRGYLGGREYDLRELSLLIRATSRIHIQLGRMYVTEADYLKLDGVRLIRIFNQHWNGSAFAGLYSNPYSRSLLTDYSTPCGEGVSGSPTTQATTPCDPGGFAMGVAAGVGGRYAYDTLWGNFGLTGSVFLQPDNGLTGSALGPSDGGPVTPDPKAMVPAGAVVLNNLYAPDGNPDKPRIFVSWMNSWRPAERVDLLSDVVIDLYGSAGPQPTRIVLLSTIRLLRNDRLTLRLGYSHLSSLAINMYLSRLLYNRLSGATLAMQGVSVVENNLTVLRTGRDEGRVTLDSRFYRKLGAFIEGRIRSRFLIGGDTNPLVYQSAAIYGNNTQNLAGDISAGLRDTGSLKGIRASLTYSGIFDFRADNHVINFDIGRDFANDRFGFTVNYVLAITKDKTPTGAMLGNCDPTSPFAAMSTCYGFRSGMTHEVGLTLTASPIRSLFFLLDYRFIALLTDPQNLVTGMTSFPPTLSHALLFRTEYRW